MTERQERYLAYRLRILPEQLDRARRRYQMLINEAKRLGMEDLINE